MSESASFPQAPQSELETLLSYAQTTIDVDDSADTQMHASLNMTNGTCTGINEPDSNNISFVSNYSIFE